MFMIQLPFSTIALKKISSKHAADLTNHIQDNMWKRGFYIPNFQSKKFSLIFNFKNPFWTDNIRTSINFYKNLYLLSGRCRASEGK